MSDPIGLGVNVSGGDITPPRPFSRRPTCSSSSKRSRAAVPASQDKYSGNVTAEGSVVPDAADTRRAATDDHASGRPSTKSFASAVTTSHRHETATSDSGFSRHDSLFSFGVSSSRNAAELKSLLGNSNSRLKSGATVLSMQDSTLDKHERRKHAVSLEQAKPRARVEVDIVLESDCFIEGGYMRGSIKLRVRKRQKKEAPVLLAEGKVRVIGFECIPGESYRHTFYQRASPLSAITDAYTGVYDSLPDSEGFSRPMEGVHILPFAMHLPIDDAFGSAKGAASIQSGVTIRYIAMISVKVKNSNTGKRSIAHFYRDCEVWPRMNPSVVLANAPRPIQASTAKSLSVIGGGTKLKLTATLHRMTWVAGQRCIVRIWIANETKKSIKSVALTLVRTTTLFKPKPHLDPGNRMSIDPDACQTATTHKVVAEGLLERSHSVAKGHASAQGWWTGVCPGQEAQFSHWILIPPEALSVSRSRLVEVEYSIRVTVSAGALTPDVHVTLPLRIINFLSVDPTPSEPLLAPGGAYTRLIPYDDLPAPGSLSHCDFESLMNVPSMIPQGGRYSDVPSLATAKFPSANPSAPQDDVSIPTAKVRRIPLNTPLCRSTRRDEEQCEPVGPVSDGDDLDADAELDGDLSMSSTGTSESDSSMFTTASSSVSSAQQRGLVDYPTRDLGNLELDDEADSDDEVDHIIGTAQLDSGRFPESASLAGGPHSDYGLPSSDNDSEVYERRAEPAGLHYTTAGDRQADSRDLYVDKKRLANRPDPRHRDGLALDRVAPAPRGGRGVYPIGRRSAAPPPAPARLETEKSTGSNSIRGPRHLREDAVNSSHIDLECEDAEDEDDGETPRLGPSAAHGMSFVSASGSQYENIVNGIRIHASPGSSQSISASSSTSGSGSGSQLRPSRQLPQPPPRPSQLSYSDIPASVSALEAIRLSHFSGGSASGSTLSRSSAHRSLPTTPTRPPSRPAHERSETVPPSLSTLTMHQRPTRALRKTGQSECSVVQGRIAVFEERLKHSRETGAAYA